MKSKSMFQHRKPLFTFFVGLAVTICSPASCQVPCHQQQSRDESGARVFERLWLDALKQSDAATLRCLLDDNFIDTTWQGRVHTRAELIAGLDDRGAFLQEVEIHRVAIYGNTGIIWGMNLIRDRSDRLVMRIAFTDVLRYEKTRWIAVAAEETPVIKPPS
jgi:hypothetical protein